MAEGFRPWAVAWADALYGERGFYRRAEGPRGHFETSANGSGGVVDRLAEAVLALAARHGCSRVVDLGAGRGELLAAMASAAGRAGAGDAAAAEPVRDLLGVDVVARPAGLPDQVGWLTAPGGPELPAGLADLAGCLVVAHEWLDVVPCEVLEVDDHGRLRVVEVDGWGAERLGDLASAESLAWTAAWWPVDGADPGTRVEVGLTRDTAWADLVSRVSSGAVVAVDYGHLAAQRPPRGSLAAHRAGRLVPPVPDGSCDVTAEVAWDSLLAVPLAPAGAMRQPPVGSDGRLPRCGSPGQLSTQRAVLTDLGVDGRRPAPGADSAAYLRDLQRASAAATLLDPGGLGGLGWLVQPVGPTVATGHAATPAARVEP